MTNVIVWNEYIHERENDEVKKDQFNKLCKITFND